MITKLLPEMRRHVEQAMCEKIKHIYAFSLSVDGWTSTAMHNYVAITCHGITKLWHLESFLLDVIHVIEAETAPALARIVKGVLTN